MDVQRIIGNTIQFGTVAAVDAATGTCTVTIGEMTSPPLPWLAQRAGKTKHWSAPSKGEQVVVLCPDGEIECGVILVGLFSNANPPPSDNENVDLTKYSDGAVISYDAETHVLTAVLPPSGSATVTALGGIKLSGPVDIDGTLNVSKAITSSVDVIADGISLKTHPHSGVKAGSDLSGKPQ